MKTQVFRIVLFVMAIVVVSGAMAQSQPGDLLVNVPFSFLVGNRQMPPGRYAAGTMRGVLRISNTQDSHSQVFVTVLPVERRAAQKPKLVFHRYGDAYFLTEVWNGDSKIGKQLPRSKAEAEFISGKVNGTPPNGEVAEVRPAR